MYRRPFEHVLELRDLDPTAVAEALVAFELASRVSTLDDFPADAYLLESDLTVEAISATLGYNDPANFRRAYKKWAGLSPRQFRNTSR